MLIILNAMAFVMVSKMQELAPFGGTLSSADGSISQRTREFLACFHLENKWKEGVRAQRQVAQASS